MPKNVAGLYMTISTEVFTVRNLVGTPVWSDPCPKSNLFTVKLCKRKGIEYTVGRNRRSIQRKITVLQPGIS